MARSDPSASLAARFTAGLLRSTVRVIMSPRFGIATQRRLIDVLSLTVPAIGGVRATQLTLGDIPTSRLDATHTHRPGAISADEKTAVLYLHGGGFVIGSAWCYRALTSRLARWTGLPIFVPDYRLAPEPPHPAQLNDALSCVQALATKGWPTERLIIAGDSAGGNLSLALVQALLAKGLPGPRALALISPWSDASSSGDRHAKDAVIDPLWIDTLRPLIGPENLLKTPAMSPVLGDFDGFAPTLIQSAGGEVLAPIVKTLVERMHAQNVPLTWTEAPGLWHDFQLHAGTVPEAARALRDMSDFMDKHSGTAQ